MCSHPTRACVCVTSGPTKILAEFWQHFPASEIMGDGGGAMLKPIHSGPNLPRGRGLQSYGKITKSARGETYRVYVDSGEGLDGSVAVAGR